MGKLKQEQNKKRHEFLLTFFPDHDDPNNWQYAVVPVNNHYLVRQWNGNFKRWEVAIYSKESYLATKRYLATHHK